MSNGVITVVYADDRVDYWPDTNWYWWQAQALLTKGDAVHIERDRDNRQPALVTLEGCNSWLCCILIVAHSLPKHNNKLKEDFPMFLNWLVAHLFFLFKYGVVSVEQDKDIFGEWISFKFLDGKMLEVYQAHTSYYTRIAVQFVDRYSNMICDFEDMFWMNESVNFGPAKAVFQRHRKAMKILELF